MTLAMEASSLKAGISIRSLYGFIYLEGLRAGFLFGRDYWKVKGKMKRPYLLKNHEVYR